jgi:hypothetical protein
MRYGSMHASLFHVKQKERLFNRVRALQRTFA